MQVNPPQNKKQPPVRTDFRNLFIWALAFLGLVYFIKAADIYVENPPREMSYAEFYQILSRDGSPRIVSASQTENMIQGSLDDGKKFIVMIPENDPELVKLLRDRVPQFMIKPPRTLWINLFYSLGPMLLFIGFLWFFVYRGAAAGGGRVLSFGKSRARQVGQGHMKVTFKDVAGVDEAQEELVEVIDFLKDPKKFQKLGGRIPKGVLLMGPPGTGKTLLAKAVAGEADVPFFSISGSDFVEMFVGVGASRVRDLFDQAKRAARASAKGAIIFIDEIDAVGRQRFAGIGGGHDEREQTLNALLVEMDGFDTDVGVILIAATNRPDVLDPALLRPGRFDRQIVIHLPDIMGREAILKVHTQKIKLASTVDLKTIAQQTSLFSGADIANLCNEAALLAARQDKEAVEQKDMLSSIERVMMGPEKKSRVMSVHERELTAYHEAGHALLSLLIPEVDKMAKVSIIPRGMAGGYTIIPPKEDRHYRSKKELLGEITLALGGRASEEVIFGDITNGAKADLEWVTHTARSMICDFGMSERLGNITLGKSHGPIFLGRDLVEEKDYSEETAHVIDEEVKRIVDHCYERARALIREHKEKLVVLAKALCEKEVLNADEVQGLLGIPEVTVPVAAAQEKRQDPTHDQRPRPSGTV